MIKHEDHENLGDQESNLVALEELADSFDNGESSLVKTGMSKTVITTKHVCGKTATKRDHIWSHAETHIHGISHACHICSKTTSTRHSLRMHITNNHAELFFCDIYGRTGMNRGTYRNHKRYNHKALSIKIYYVVMLKFWASIQRKWDGYRLKILYQT